MSTERYDVRTRTSQTEIAGNPLLATPAAPMTREGTRERLAKALYDRDGQVSGEGVEEAHDWRHQPEAVRDYWRTEAGHILALLASSPEREPERMVRVLEEIADWPVTRWSAGACGQMVEAAREALAPAARPSEGDGDREPTQEEWGTAMIRDLTERLRLAEQEREPEWICRGCGGSLDGIVGWPYTCPTCKRDSATGEDLFVRAPAARPSEGDGTALVGEDAKSRLIDMAACGLYEQQVPGTPWYCNAEGAEREATRLYDECFRDLTERLRLAEQERDEALKLVSQAVDHMICSENATEAAEAALREIAELGEWEGHATPDDKDDPCELCRIVGIARRALSDTPGGTDGQ